MQLTSKLLLDKINTHIAQLDYVRNPMNLYLPVQYVLSLGGKRIRPVLMLMTHNLFSPDVDDILDPAVGIEIYHNFTLLHDDLMDRATMRRGHQTVHLKWNDNTAVLSGDVMLSLADLYMSHCPDIYFRRVIETFTRTAIEITEGQQYDMDFESRDDVTEKEYMEMIRLKTSVLIACSMKIGAILGGSSDVDAENLYKAGEQMGLAFQLHDDYLDVYGDTESFGKKTGGDILCNKKTFLYIMSMRRASPAQRDELQRWFSIRTTDISSCQQKIDAVTKLYTELNMPCICKEQEDKCYRLAHRYLDKVEVCEDKKKVLREYLADMMNRKV